MEARPLLPRCPDLGTPGGGKARYNEQVSGVRTRRVMLREKESPMDTFALIAELCSILSLLIGLLDLLIGMRKARKKAKRVKRKR